MNLDNLKINGVNTLYVNDSLYAPLLELKIKCNQNTIIPNTNELIVYVDKEQTITEERKEYVFEIHKKLEFLEVKADEFIIEPLLLGETIHMHACKKKVYLGNDLIENQHVDYQAITLFEGNNYIYTNYKDADIEIIYPKNCDIVKYFVNNTSYFKQYNEGLNLKEKYYENAFTETEHGINIEANNIDINCITSKKNNFSLDNEGNLSVQSITSANGESGGGSNPLDIYPIGSIYMNITEINPGDFFGGSWEQIKDRFLLGCGTTYNNTTTGGSATHVLITNELPGHTHTGTTSSGGDHTHNAQGYWRASSDMSQNRVLSYARVTGDAANNTYGTTSILNAGAHTHTMTSSSVGSGQAHNNMPPYLTVYIWKRIA